VWAYNNLQAEVDYGYRATHVAALAGKAIGERYYGRVPSKAYFMGCSTGGRQGLVEAQRFPWDFAGIVAGAPSTSETYPSMHSLWAARVTLDEAGRSLFSQADLQLLHAAVLAKCDMDDGLRDGIVGGPDTCKFDPAVLECPNAKRSRTDLPCMSAAKVAAARKVYEGPMTSQGERLTRGMALPGSELNWTNYRNGGQYAEGEFRYLAFVPEPGSSWKAADFDFDRDYKRLGMMESLYDASNPDLRKFKAAGGKILLYHGWSDESWLPRDTVDYYETTERTMGGRETTQDFFRLFMLPGVNHCTGGDGAFAIDYLSYLEAWVERGQPPDMMTGAHIPDSYFAGRGAYAVHALTFPLDPAVPVNFTRPVFPYPNRALYRGGPVTEASSFQPAFSR